MSLFGLIAHVLGWVAFALAGWKGGQTERLGAAVLVCDYLLTIGVARLPIAAPHRAAMLAPLLTALALIWMSFRLDRWWLLVAAAAVCLCGLVTLLEILRPDVSLYAALSAQLGLWAVTYLALIAGVAERWLAAERPASRWWKFPLPSRSAS
ncbi:hypothetical protein GCM10009116_21420 [Brevundimonas basaltis]|uniref:Uncharacterized protein n=1 Tax=Brevundimonas basaltis TaxID=472166 RepID=A0A7W8HXS9_9CAUL|nr:hypothetical protein [Brevundimonas basaltis]MBB5291891.1 hypothetical protein [Brevundimonas basaltis]